MKRSVPQDQNLVQYNLEVKEAIEEFYTDLHEDYLVAASNFAHTMKLIRSRWPSKAQKCRSLSRAEARRIYLAYHPLPDSGVGKL